MHAMSLPIWPAKFHVNRGQRSHSGINERAAAATYNRLEAKNNVQLRAPSDNEGPNVKASNTNRQANASLYKLKYLRERQYLARRNSTTILSVKVTVAVLCAAKEIVSRLNALAFG